jgi:hypothetical protein
MCMLLPTCVTEGGKVLTPPSSGQGPKSYLLQKACLPSLFTSTKHSSVLSRSVPDSEAGMMRVMASMRSSCKHHTAHHTT